MSFSHIDVNHFVNNCDVYHDQIVELSALEKIFSPLRKTRLDAFVKKQLEQVSLTNPNSLQILSKANEYRRTFSVGDKDLVKTFIYRYLSAHFNDQFQLKVNQRRAVGFVDSIGLNGALAKKYPDFMDFLSASNLVKQMKLFGHKVDEIDGQPAMLFEGELTTWENIKKELDLTSKKPDELILPYGYRYVDKTVDENGKNNPYGIVKQDLIKWEKLTPTYMHNDKELLGKHFVEIIGNTKNGWGHHWMRLIDDRGNVIPVGFNRGAVPYLKPIAMYKGRIMQMDPCEYEDYSHIATKIFLSPEEYFLIIQKIEKDNQTGNNGFSYYRRNCAKYTSEILEQIGIKVDNNEYPAQSLARRVLEYFRIKEVHPYISNIAYVVLQIVRKILSPFFNIGLWVLGVNHLDQNYVRYLEENNLEGVKPIEFQLFSTETFRYSSPYKLRQWQHWVENRRENLLEKVHIEYMEGRLTKQEYEHAKFEARFGKPPSLETNKLFVTQ